jgi:hypothetical protein
MALGYETTEWTLARSFESNKYSNIEELPLKRDLPETKLKLAHLNEEAKL